MGGADGGRAAPGGLSAIGVGAGLPEPRRPPGRERGGRRVGRVARGPERIRGLRPDALLAWSLVAPSEFAAGTRRRTAPFEKRRRIG